MQRHCDGPGPNSSSPTTTTLSSVQPGDMVSALIAVDHHTARQDVASGIAVPISKLIDRDRPSSGDQPQSKEHAPRFFKHA